MALVSTFTICEFFKTDPNLVKRGQNALDGGHLLDARYDGGGRSAGVVLSSFEQKKYEVELAISGQKVISASCQCPNGRHQCHHMAVMLLWMETNITRTDIECQWKKPRNNTETSAKRATQLWPSSSKATVNREIDDEDRLFLKAGLEELSRFTGMGWMLKKEPPKMHKDTVKHLLQQSLSCEENDRIGFIMSGLAVTESQRAKVCQLTIGQRLNQQWHTMRYGRVTASNFAKVLQAVKRRSYPPSLFKTLCGGYASAANASAIKWGTVHEKEAIAAFSSSFGVKVEPCGLYLDSTGVLGASPNGIITPDHLIEVKCPFSGKDCSLREAVQKHASKKTKFFLGIDEQERVTLVQSHDYYDQIQGNLYMTDARICTLVVWTPTELMVQNVPRDPQWAVNLPVLKDFWKNIFLPHLLSIQTKQ